MVENADSPIVLKTTIKIVVAVGLLSVGAANLLSGSRLDTTTLARIAGQMEDGPTVTGSLARSAADTRLDPCAVARRP